MTKSLVEKLRHRASQQFISGITSDYESGYYDGAESAYLNAANLAESYKARRLALERVRNEARYAFKSILEDIKHMPAGTVLKDRINLQPGPFIEALAAVPNISDEKNT